MPQGDKSWLGLRVAARGQPEGLGCPRTFGMAAQSQVFKRPLREAAAPILESYSAGAEPPELLPESLQGPCHFEITRGLNKRAETQPRPGQAGRLLPVSLKNR